MPDTTVFGLDAILPTTSKLDYKPITTNSKALDLSSLMSQRQLNQQRDIANRQLDLQQKNLDLRQRIFEEVQLRQQALAERRFEDYELPMLDLQKKQAELNMIQQIQLEEQRQFERDKYFDTAIGNTFNDPVFGNFVGIGNAKRAEDIRKKHQLGDEDISELTQNMHTSDDIEKTWRELARRTRAASLDPDFKTLVVNETRQAQLQAFLKENKDAISPEGQEYIIAQMRALENKDTKALDRLDPTILYQFVEGQPATDVERYIRLFNEGRLAEFSEAMNAGKNPRSGSSPVTPQEVLERRNILSNQGNFTDQFKSGFAGSRDNVFRVDGKDMSQAELMDEVESAMAGQVDADKVRFRAIPDHVSMDGTVFGRWEVNNEAAKDALEKKFNIQFQKNSATGKWVTGAFPVELAGGTAYGEVSNSPRDIRPAMDTPTVLHNMSTVQAQTVRKYDENGNPVQFPTLVGKSGGNFLSPETLIASEVFYHIEADPKKGPTSINNSSSALGQYQYLWGSHGDRIREYLQLDEKIASLTPADRSTMLGALDELLPRGNRIRDKYERDKQINPVEAEKDVLAAITFMVKPDYQRKMFERDLFVEYAPNLSKLRKMDEYNNYSDMQLMYMLHHEGSLKNVQTFFTTGKLASLYDDKDRLIRASDEANNVSFVNTLKKIADFSNMSGIPKEYSFAPKMQIPATGSHIRLRFDSDGEGFYELVSADDQMQPIRMTKKEVDNVIRSAKITKHY